MKKIIATLSFIGITAMASDFVEDKMKTLETNAQNSSKNLKYSK